MEDCYPVYFGSEQSGKVQVIKRGLYYRFVCRCILSGEVICRLHVRFGQTGDWESLGVVVPMDDGFGLETSLPVKRFAQGTPQFRLLPKHEKPVSGTFIPISPEEPFAYIARLKDAFLVRQGGQVGIMVEDAATG